MSKTSACSAKIKVVRGEFSAKGRCFGIVVSRWNEYLTSKLLEGALDTLLRHGARSRDIRVVEVPGAFELPLAARRLIRSNKPDAVIALAVVIKGETRHFDQIVTESAKGLRELAAKTEVPVILGIIPARNSAHAIARVGVKQVNKGREWAQSAIEMANLMRKMPIKDKGKRR